MYCIYVQDAFRLLLFHKIHTRHIANRIDAMITIVYVVYFIITKWRKIFTGTSNSTETGFFTYSAGCAPFGKKKKNIIFYNYLIRIAGHFVWNKYSNEIKVEKIVFQRKAFDMLSTMVILCIYASHSHRDATHARETKPPETIGYGK